jgi:hypothetical protein
MEVVMEQMPSGSPQHSIELSINGKKIGMNQYVRSVFYSILTGLVKTLKNIEEPEEIVIRIKNG